MHRSRSPTSKKVLPSEEQESTIKRIVRRQAKRSSSSRSTKKSVSKQRKRNSGTTHEDSCQGISTSEVFLPLAMLKTGTMFGHEGVFLPLAIIDTKTNSNIVSVNHKAIADRVFESEQSMAKPEPLRQSQETSTVWISFSGFEREDVKILRKKAKSLKNCREVEVSVEKITHLIVGDATTSKRLLFCLIFDVPILHQSFILDSYKAGQWLDFEDYQSSLFPLVGARPKYDEIFQNIKIHVFPTNYGEEFSQYWIIYLLMECNCEVVDSEEEADIIISNRHHKQTICNTHSTKVHFEWIFECILQGMVVNNSEYLFYH